MSVTPSANLYHPLALESPSEEAPSRRNQYLSTPTPPTGFATPPKTASGATDATTASSRDPLYFETEPIYSDAYTPRNQRKKEPLYHETIPDDSQSSQPPSTSSSSLSSSSSSLPITNHTLSTAQRKSITPPQTLSRRIAADDTPPPVPTSRRPSGAIFTPPSGSFIENGGSETTENTMM